MNSIDSAISSLIAAKQSEVQSPIAFTLAVKGLEAQRSHPEAVAQLLTAAAKLSKAVGKDNHFDAVA